MAMAVCLILRHVEALGENPVLDLVPRCFHGVGRHVAHARRVLSHVFLHLQCFNTIGELDKLDAAPETRPGRIGTNLGQQVLVAGSLARQPAVMQCILLRVNIHSPTHCQMVRVRTSLVGRFLGSAFRRHLMKSFASSLTSLQ